MEVARKGEQAREQHRDELVAAEGAEALSAMPIVALSSTSAGNWIATGSS